MVYLKKLLFISMLLLFVYIGYEYLKWYYYNNHINKCYTTKNRYRLCQIASDQDVNVCIRVRAIYYLGCLADNRDTDFLISIFDIPYQDASIYAAASNAIATVMRKKNYGSIFGNNPTEYKAYWQKIVKDESKYEILFEYLSNEHAAVRFYAAQRLGELQINSQEGIRKLVDTLADPHVVVRGAALDSLEKLGMAAIPYLQDYLKNQNFYKESMRTYIQQTIQNILRQSKHR